MATPANAAIPGPAATLGGGSGMGGRVSTIPCASASAGRATYRPLGSGVKLSVNLLSASAIPGPHIGTPWPAAAVKGCRLASFSTDRRAATGSYRMNVRRGTRFGLPALSLSSGCFA